MQDFSSVIAVAVFLGVIVIIGFELLDLTVTALLGALLLVFTHVMTLEEAIDYISHNHGTLALFLGVMVLVRAFEPTKIFEYLATKMVMFTKGSGKYLLLGIVAITAPLSAILPNATTVVLLAPLIPPLAADIGVDFVPLLILMTFIANSAGLLTLVGDPVTFMIGDAINMSFINYLKTLSLGGFLAIMTVVVLLPWLFKDIWEVQFQNLENLPHPKVNHPIVLGIGTVIVIFVLIFFIFGESMTIPVAPAAVALMGATMALLLAHQSKIDTVNNILRDVDWSTLLFFMSFFVLIGGLEKTGVISQLSAFLAMTLGSNILLSSMLLLLIVGLLSSFIPNIPLVVGMVPLLQEYLISVNLLSPDTLSPQFTGQFPEAVLPLFYAMMYGATLGGNGTLIGASANIVAAGIAEQHGKKITFHRFLKYGLIVMALQLSVSAVYMLVFFMF